MNNSTPLQYMSCECDIIWKRSLCRYNLVKDLERRWSWVYWVCSKFRDTCPRIKKTKRHTEEEGGIVDCSWDWRSPTCTNQGTLRIAASPTSKKEAWNRFSLRATGRNNLCQCLDFGILGSRSVREYISALFSRMVCDSLL